VTGDRYPRLSPLSLILYPLASSRTATILIGYLSNIEPISSFPCANGFVLKLAPMSSLRLLLLPRRGCLTIPEFLVVILTMTVLPLGDVKSHLSELVGRVHDHHERVTVTVHGRPSAILIAPEDLEALEETLAIMRDAATMNRLAESDAELARGEYVSAEELSEAMRRRQAQ
jgi:antitoxin YefM